LLQLIRVLRLDPAPVAVVPPVIDVVPWPFLDIEDVVSDDGEAALEADLDAADRRSHQRDGDDADDHAEGREDRAHLVRLDLSKGDAETFGELDDDVAHGCGLAGAGSRRVCWWESC